MKWWQIALIAMAIWNGIGFFAGLIDSADSRNLLHYVTNANGGLDRISDAKSGCVYRSFAAFTSPGYLIGCELSRKRFEMEGFTDF